MTERFALAIAVGGAALLLGPTLGSADPSEAQVRPACERVVSLLEEAQGDAFDPAAVNVDACVRDMLASADACADFPAALACLEGAQTPTDMVPCEALCQQPAPSEIPDGVPFVDACANVLRIGGAEPTEPAYPQARDRCASMLREAWSTCADGAASVACMASAAGADDLAWCELHCMPPPPALASELEAKLAPACERTAAIIEGSTGRSGTAGPESCQLALRFVVDNCRDDAASGTMLDCMARAESYEDNTACIAGCLEAP